MDSVISIVALSIRGNPNNFRYAEPPQSCIFPNKLAYQKTESSAQVARVLCLEETPPKRGFRNPDSTVYRL